MDITRDNLTGLDLIALSQSREHVNRPDAEEFWRAHGVWPRFRFLYYVGALTSAERDYLMEYANQPTNVGVFMAKETETAPGQYAPLSAPALWTYHADADAAIWDVIGDSMFRESDPVSDVFRRAIRRSIKARIINEALPRLTADADDETLERELLERGQADFEHALRRARLHKLASENRAPKDKLEAIKGPIRAAFKVGQARIKAQARGRRRRLANALRCLVALEYPGKTETYHAPHWWQESHDRAIRMAEPVDANITALCEKD